MRFEYLVLIQMESFQQLFFALIDAEIIDEMQ